MFVLVSLTLFQSTNINTPLLQTGIKLYLQLYLTSALLLIFMRCSIKVNIQKSRQSHLPVFWKFSLQNLGKSPKSLHTTSKWMNSYCHRLFSLCPLFHFCWKWGVCHSPSFAIPQLSPMWRYQYLLDVMDNVEELYNQKIGFWDRNGGIHGTDSEQFI